MEKTDERINRKKLTEGVKPRLIAVVLLLVAIPLTIAITLMLIRNNQSGNEQMNKYNDYQSQVVEENFFQTVAVNYATLQTVSHSAEAAQTLLGNLDLAYIEGWLKKVDAEMTDGSYMSLIDANGMQIYSTSGLTADVSGSDFFKTVKSTKAFYASDILYIPETGSNICVFVYPILDEDGTFLGAIERNYNLDTLVESIKAQVTEKGQDIFVVDNSGNVLAHSSIDVAKTPMNLSDRDWYIKSRSSRSSFDTFETDHDGSLQVASYRREPLTGWTTVVTRDVHESMKDSQLVFTLTIIVGIAMLIIAGIITYALANSFTKPIYAIERSLYRITEGYFEPVEDEKLLKRTDEFGDIVKSSNTVILSLKSLVGKIKDHSEKINASAEEFYDMSEQIAKTAEEVSSAVQDIATGATKQADEVQGASTNAGYIGDAVTEVQGSARTLDELSGKMKEASEASGTSLAGLKSSSTVMTEKIGDITGAISATQEAVSSISEKVSDITSIATQTNLLSLNASIEAARAGEAGRGFAVVAEEIGNLADNSKKLADDIKHDMDRLLDQMGSAVSAADVVKEANADQQSSIGETIESINGMLEDIGATVDEIKNISQGADRCEKSKSVVVDSLLSLSSISEENAASSEETGASMQELSATVTTLADSATKLKDISGELKKEISFFKI